MGGRISRPRTSERLIVSVIVPTLNEEHNIADAVASALGEESDDSGRTEVLVVDGGSTDKTTVIAKKMGARVLCSQPGRAKQMNLGWQHSTGDWLLFLHADCKLPQRYRAMLHAAMYAPNQTPGPSWGCFETIDADIGCSLQQQLLRQAVQFRTRRRHMPYGDQGIFVKSTLFRELGGFKDLPIMEDYELVGRLQEHGVPAIIPHAMQTSGRRWQTVGFLQTTLTNQAIILAYHCGVPVPTLANWYRKGMR